MNYLLGDLIEKNISKRVFFSISIVAIAISLLDFIFSFLSEISDLSDSYILYDALFYSVNAIPISVYSYLPYICLVGALVGLGSLKEDGEIIGSRVLGKSNFKIVLSALRPALLIIGLGFLFQETFLPTFSQQNEETKLIKQNKISSEEGYWYVSNSSINFFQTSPSRYELNNVISYQYGKKNDLTRILNAKYAKKVNDAWMLFDIQVNDFEKLTISFKDRESWKDGPNERDFRKVLSPKYFSIVELKDAIKESNSEYRVNVLLLEYWNKIFNPLLSILLIILAATFVFGNIRDDSLGGRILVGILFAFSLNIANTLFEGMASVSLLKPFYAVGLPVLSILLLTILLWNFRKY